MLYPLLELIEIIHDTDYGSVAAHRFDINQTKSLQTTKRAHDHDELLLIKELYNKYKENYHAHEKNKVIDKQQANDPSMEFVCVINKLIIGIF